MSSSESEAALQSPEMRKNLLRSALKSAYTLNENVNKNTMANLESLMDKTDIVAKEAVVDDMVNDHEEVVLDAHVISLSSHIMRKCTLNVTKELNNYDPREFAENITNYLLRQSNSHEENINFSLLEDFVEKIFFIHPKFQSLQGCLTPLIEHAQENLNKEGLSKEELEKLDTENQSIFLKRPRLRNREPPVPVKRPKNVIISEKDEINVENSVENIKHLVIKYYEQHQTPLHFFKLVIDPHDFGKTIENLLHVSFLVRDGVLKIFKDDKGALLIEIVHKKELHEVKKSNKKSVQNVFTINKEEWKILTKAYGIKQPMIDFDKQED